MPHTSCDVCCQGGERHHYFGEGEYEEPERTKPRLLSETGLGEVGSGLLYQVIRQPAPNAARQFDIEFLDAGVEAFAFTFG